jgi:predicted DNA-binding transcriptional regulator YafY
VPKNLLTPTRPQLYRCAIIHRTVKAGGYPNANRLSADLGVHRRTILRDLDYMRDSLSAPLEYCPRKRGFYYTEKDYSIDLLNLTEGELLSLCLGHNLLLKCRGMPYEKHIASAFGKICALLQKAIPLDFGFADHITFDLEPLRGKDKIVAGNFAVIGTAMRRKKSIKITHYAIARDDRRERLVDPYYLRYYQGVWYLIAFCHLRNEYRFFALDRISNITCTGRDFQIRSDFDVEQFMQDSFQLYRGDEALEVKIWFSPRQARWIREKQWHPTQKLAEQPDGSIILAMTTSGLTQVKSWILGFGSEARALAPQALVKEIENELDRSRQNYT